MTAIANTLRLGHHVTPETSDGRGGDIRFGPKGRPVKQTLTRVGETSREFLQQHAKGICRVLTDNEEIVGYMIRNDLAGVRVGHCVGFKRRGYNQPSKAVWVIDDIKLRDVRSIEEMH